MASTLGLEGIEAIMLRTVNQQPTLWEAILPEALLGLPAELEAVDRLLDDPVFFEPYRAFFHATLGRPSIPIETYLRLMFLKYRYRLGFEPLCREVADSISWQRFCRIPLGGTVAHPTTLMKITTRCGTAAVDGLNETLLAKAAAAKVLKTNRVRADTTVVEADVVYPTDSGLLAKGVARMAALAKRIQAGGLAVRTPYGPRSETGPGWCTGTPGRSPRTCGDALTRPARTSRRSTSNSPRWPRRRSVRHGRSCATHNAACSHARQRSPDGSTRCCQMLRELQQLATRVERVVAQTRLRISGVTPDGATRLVSLHDPDARPIAKGRLGRPVEFGYKAQVIDNDDGIVVDYQVERGNPPDAPMLAPAIRRVARRAGRPPRAVTADRGYGETAVEQAVRDLGVRTVALPTKGKPTAARRAWEQRRSFQRLVKWRTGSEGRISCLKRDFGWARTRIDGLQGARTWCGHGVFNHNLVKIAALVA